MTKETENGVFKSVVAIMTVAAVGGSGLSWWNSSEDNTTRGQVVLTMNRLDSTVEKMAERLRLVELKVAVIQSDCGKPTPSGTR